MMLGKHTIDVHVKRSGTCFIVASMNEPDVNAFAHELSNDRVITPIPADPIPAQADDALKQATA